MKEALAKIDTSVMEQANRAAQEAKDKIDAVREAMGGLSSAAQAEQKSVAELHELVDGLKSAARAFPSDEEARNRVLELERQLAEERTAHSAAKEEIAGMKIKVAESSAALATGAAKVSTLAAQVASFVDKKKELMRLVATLKAMRAADGSLYSDDELKMIIQNCLLVPKEEKDEVLEQFFRSG